jgi:hypothetical protein
MLMNPLEPLATIEKYGPNGLVYSAVPPGRNTLTESPVLDATTVELPEVNHESTFADSLTVSLKVVMAADNTAAVELIPTF